MILAQQNIHCGLQMWSHKCQPQQAHTTLKPRETQTAEERALPMNELETADRSKETT